MYSYKRLAGGVVQCRHPHKYISCVASRPSIFYSKRLLVCCDKSLSSCRDQEVWRAVLYDEDIAIAKALIAHLQATTGSSMSYSSDYVGNDGDSPSSSSTNLDPPECGAATATGGGVTSPRDNSVSHKPGEFLRKKDKEDEVLVPTRWTVVRRKSKREKRRSTVSLCL